MSARVAGLQHSSVYSSVVGGGAELVCVVAVLLSLALCLGSGSWCAAVDPNGSEDDVGAGLVWAIARLGVDVGRLRAPIRSYLESTEMQTELVCVAGHPLAVPGPSEAYLWQAFLTKHR